MPTKLANATPLAQLKGGKLALRLSQLFLALFLYGFSLSLMIRAQLGLDPWDTFHDGLSDLLPLSFGSVVILTGVCVLLLWIPLRQMPGLGTIANAIIIGLAADLGLMLIADGDSLTARVSLLIMGIVLNGVATASYIGAQLGPGPRDGLMTGIVNRTGWSVQVVRTSIEVSVLFLGWLLGGSIGIGTLAYAFSIGPLVQFMLPLFIVPIRDSNANVSSADAGVKQLA